MKLSFKDETTPSLWVLAFLSFFPSFFLPFFPSFIRATTTTTTSRRRPSLGPRPTHVWQIWLIVSRSEQIIEVNGSSETFHSARSWSFSKGSPIWKKLGYLPGCSFIPLSVCVKGCFGVGGWLCPTWNYQTKMKQEVEWIAFTLGHRDHNLFGAHVCAAKRTHHMRKNDLTQSLSRKWKVFFSSCTFEFSLLNFSSMLMDTVLCLSSCNGYFPWVCLTVKRRTFAFLRTERNSLNKMVIRCLNKGRFWFFFVCPPSLTSASTLGSVMAKTSVLSGNMKSRQPCTPPLDEALAAFSVSKTIWIFKKNLKLKKTLLFVFIRTIWHKWLLSVTAEQGVQGQGGASWWAT